jgi:hypothetical protein
MNLDGLNGYATNPAFYDGVTITLDDAPDYQFLVILPGADNRAYLAALAKEIGVERGEIDTYLVSERLFLDHCLVSINGEPIPDNFHITHKRALKAIMAKASEMSAAIQEEVAEAEKKSVTTSNGSIDGVAA